jgi:hypothetical protein
MRWRVCRIWNELVEVGEAKRDGRDVDAFWGAGGGDGFYFEEAVGHDEVDCFAVDKVAVETGEDLAEGFDEGAELDGADGSSWKEGEINTRTTGSSYMGGEG